jgi:hypothetical protein
MPARNGWLTGAVVFVLVLLTAGPAAAARVRFHYATADPGGVLTLVSEGPAAASAERQTLLGSWEPYNCPPPHATCIVTFCHPCTGQTVLVPLGLPDSTPRMEHRPNRVIYNYGSYTVEVHFLPDGRVDVIYNSGLFRAL